MKLLVYAGKIVILKDSLLMEVFNFLGPGTIGGTNGILLMILIDLNV
jgi:hypothetical protein